jgi:hypothetical protein
MMRAVLDLEPDVGGPPQVDWLFGTDAAERITRDPSRYRFLAPGESPYASAQVRATWKVTQ